MVAIGSETAALGDTLDGSDPLSKAAIRFGFVASGTEADECDRFNSIVACAVNGSSYEEASFAVSSSSWYRFVLRTRPLDGTYDLDIYQQGTTHQDAAAPNGTLVASYTGLSYADGAEHSIDAIGILSGGVRGFLQCLDDDPGCAIFDNILVDGIPIGTSVILR